MKEKFIEKRFNKSSLATIEQANEIVADYMRQGFKLTLRQLYYQFVRRIWIENKQSEYKRLGAIVSDARMAGLIDWSAIEDRTRNLEKLAMWADPESILSAVANQYKENPWDLQPNYMEVWIEKEALVGVIEPVCEEFRVPYLACRGYTSQSEIYDAGKRLRSMRQSIGGQRKLLVLYLGDFDPSGLDMDRSNDERTCLFARQHIDFRRLALTRDQIDQYNPPPNPAKDTDARFEAYRDVHGDESWELDALDPVTISGIIRNAIVAEIDEDAWQESMAAESRNQQGLQAASDRWPEVLEFLNEGGDE